MQQAIREGVLSINHRSKEFTKISSGTISLLKKKLNIPGDYTVFFTSSATECWEIIAQSLIRKKSLHLYNGSFGEKWFDYTGRIVQEARGISFDLNEELLPERISAAEDAEIICLVQNETSNATQISPAILASFRKRFSDKLIAVDATSSMGGIKLNFRDADVWLASIQKCFGLPAGLGLLICSPAAIKRARELNENDHYNSLIFLDEKMKVWQTSHTPNVLLIYLLGKILKELPAIAEIHRTIAARAKDWYSFFGKSENMKLLVSNKNVRSLTVIAVRGNEEELIKLKERAKKEGILLGNGYGKWSRETFRIANFPAIRESEIVILKKFLKQRMQRDN
jgi:phosphoserine aminotransferase